MIQYHVDLGQLIIAALILILGVLVNFQLTRFNDRLDEHDRVLYRLTGVVQAILGPGKLLDIFDNKKFKKDQ